MRLLLKRNQAEGLLGGVKFVLFAQAQLTRQEEQLVKKYGAGKEVLLKKEVKIPFFG